MGNAESTWTRVELKRKERGVAISCWGSILNSLCRQRRSAAKIGKCYGERSAQSICVLLSAESVRIAPHNSTTNSKCTFRNVAEFNTEGNFKLEHITIFTDSSLLGPFRRETGVLLEDYVTNMTHFDYTRSGKWFRPFVDLTQLSSCFLSLRL